MIRPCRYRRRLSDAIAALMRPVEVLRAPQEGAAPQVFYRGEGYLFSKFERVTTRLGAAGQISHEQTNRILLSSSAPDNGCCSPDCDGRRCALPAVLPGDLCRHEGKSYRVTAVQDGLGVYLTLVVEEVEAE